jgi:hypothetical protein
LARDRLLAGDFADAAERFDALARKARSAVDRSRCEELRDLARSWDARGLVFVPRSALGESALSAKAVGERTTDEIASLYINAVFYGIGTGVWLDVRTTPSSTAAAVLPALLFAGAAVGGVAAIDVTHPLHYGVPQSIVSGLYIGFEQGLVLQLWNQADGNQHWQTATAAADVIWTFSTIGAVGGGVLGATLGTTPGRASFVGSTALWSGLVASLVSAAATGDGATRATDALLAAEVGLNLGTMAGLFSASAVSPSIGRVRFLDLGGLAGLLVGGGLYLAAAENRVDGQAASAATGLGVLTGLTIAWAATSRMPADRTEPARDRPKDSMSYSPTLMPVRGGTLAGLVGTF